MAAGDVTCAVTSQSARSNTNDGTVSAANVSISGGDIAFAGTNGTVNLGNLNAFINGVQTISLWLNIKKSGSQAELLYMAVVNNRVYLAKSNVDNLFVALGNTYNTFRVAASWSADTLYHFVMIRDQTNQKGTIYWNGNYLTEFAVTTIDTATNGNLHMGSTGAANFLVGSLTNLQIFNRALTQAEITQIYEAGKDAYSPVTSGLVAQYSGRDYFGTTAAPTKILDTASINKSTAALFERNLKQARKTANDKYIADEVNNQILFSHIEEA
jgi:hypothetical protein